MVSTARTAVGLGRIRALNRPRSLEVKVGTTGKPVAVRMPAPGEAEREHRSLRAGAKGSRGFSGGLAGDRRPWRRVEHIVEVWRIDEGWWRPQGVARLYYRVVLEDGAVVDMYRDLVHGCWYQQRYGR